MSGSGSGRLRRVLVLGLLVVALSPGLWWRAEFIPDAGPVVLDFEPVEASRPASWPAELDLQGVWQLKGGTRVHGYSALLVSKPNEFIAFSDTGSTLRFSFPDASERVEAGWVARQHPGQRDQESATLDPGTGEYWVGYEGVNAIVHFDSAGKMLSIATPSELAHWPANGGPEAMVRLHDGSFIVMAESAESFRFTPGPGLLFRGGLQPDHPIKFRNDLPPNFLATDMAELPDGRVIVLLRKLAAGIPPGFASKLILADPKDIKAGEVWPWTPLADLEEPFPQDNYEGLAIVPESDGAVTIWLISDDNRSAFQRTLLAKLHWQPGERGSSGSK